MCRATPVCFDCIFEHCRNQEAPTWLKDEGHEGTIRAGACPRRSTCCSVGQGTDPAVGEAMTAVIAQTTTGTNLDPSVQLVSPDWSCSSGVSSNFQDSLDDCSLLSPDSHFIASAFAYIPQQVQPTPCPTGKDRKLAFHSDSDRIFRKHDGKKA